MASAKAPAEALPLQDSTVPSVQATPNLVKRLEFVFTNAAGRQDERWLLLRAESPPALDLGARNPKCCLVPVEGSATSANPRRQLVADRFSGIETGLRYRAGGRLAPFGTGTPHFRLRPGKRTALSPPAAHSLTRTMTGATEVCRRPPAAPAQDDEASGAMSVVVAVEKSLLRTLAFVLYQLDRSCAKYCASSVLQWYMQLQTQLPVAAVDSLDRVADSVISLSDAQFTDFWRSLVAKEIEEASYRRQQILRHRQHRHRRLEDDASSSSSADEEQHVVKRFYQQLFLGVQRFFAAEPSDKGRTQTPCTSPVDLMDASHRQPQHSARHLYHRMHDADYQSESSLSGAEASDDEFEPGWAVEYMEQDANIPSEMSRRMAKMMHSNVPANLFRATVTLSGCDDDDQGMDYYMGAVTPGSFPPTPITRDLQTRRMNHYTVTVLDHATLTLRLLTEENYG